MIKTNEKAPAFTLMDQDKNLVSLSDFENDTIVLYFYPKDDTPGCTTQACSYKDSKPEFEKRNVKVIGVSKDDVKSHLRFQNKYELNFPLLSDPETEVVQRYEVWKEKSRFGKTYMGIERTTFIIKQGIIKEIFENVDPKKDVELVLNALDNLS
jgi:peroxiredoxin Q/BCP